MPSGYESEVTHALFDGTTVDVPAGASGTVVDLRKFSHFAIWQSAGGVTKQPCDSAGTALPGAVATAVTIGVVNERVSHYTKIVATTNAAKVVLY